jgi:FkbM family methyltransferase
MLNLPKESSIYIIGTLPWARISYKILKKKYQIKGYIPCNSLGEYLKSYKDIRDIIISSSFITGKQLGIKICNINEIDKDAYMFLAFPQTIKKLIHDLECKGFHNIVPINKFFFNKKNYKIYCNPSKELRNQYNRVRALFKDKQSLKVFDAIIGFRFSKLSSNSVKDNWFVSIASSRKRQYFESFIKYRREPFVDCGAFDGDTIAKFISFANNKYSKIYAFEPDILLYKKLQNKFCRHKKIKLFNKCVSNKTQSIFFNSQHDGLSHISSKGTEKVSSVILDKSIKEKKCFIKMDVEGAELNILKGATRLIDNGSILAISVYHKMSDIIKIPIFIKKTNENYNFYLRHYYADIPTGTVLYAIPKKN